MCRLPLWTAKVRPTKSGVMVERRDQVLIAGGRLPPCRISSTFFSRCRSMNGPFFTERAMSFRFAPLQRDEGGGMRDERTAVSHPALLIPHPSSFIPYLTRLSRTIIFEVRLFLRVL